MNDTLLLLTVFAVSFIKVATRASQQLNVVYGDFKAVVPNSYIMAYTELFIAGISALQVVDGRYFFLTAVGFMYGTGGWTGCWSAMWLHKRSKK